MADFSMIRLLIVISHAVVRQELVSFLEIQEDLKVVGQTDNGAEALEMLSKVKPDVVVVDLKLPDMDGVSAAQTVLRQMVSVRVVLLANLEDEERYAEALRIGAFICLPKYNARDLLKAIRVHSACILTADQETGKL